MFVEGERKPQVGRLSNPGPVSPRVRPVAPTCVDKFTRNTGSDSFYRVSVPLSDENFPLRLKYRRYDGGVRMGRQGSVILMKVAELKLQTPGEDVLKT